MPCICPLDGSTCWTCGDKTPRACEDQAYAIDEIRAQAFIIAGIQIGSCLSTDEAVSRLIDAVRKEGKPD